MKIPNPSVITMLQNPAIEAAVRALAEAFAAKNPETNSDNMTVAEVLAAIEQIEAAYPDLVAGFSWCRVKCTLKHAPLIAAAIKTGNPLAVAAATAALAECIQRCG